MRTVLICDDCYPAEAATLCAEYECGIEIQSFYDPSHILAHPDTIETHLPLVEGIRPRSFHGPFGDLSPGSFDSMVRDLAMYRFEEAAAIAERLRADHMVLHLGYRPYTGPQAPTIKRSIAFWKQFLEPRSRDFHLHLENVHEPEPEILAEVIDAVDDARIDVNLDIGHIRCFSHGDPIYWIKTLRHRIGYVHLHDNHGTEDEHLGLGMGNIPLEQIFGTLQEYSPNAIWALECKMEFMRKSLDWIARFR